MRLIDADALLDSTSHWDDFCGYKVLNPHIKRTDVYKQPTVDPVKRGHWIPNMALTFECSVCGCDAPFKAQNWQPIPYESNYCPHCGAKMDEEVSE